MLRRSVALLLFILITLCSESQVLQWSKKAGGAQNDNGYRSVVDKNGNLYLSGSFQGTGIDFDPGPGVFALSSSGVYDGFVAKYDLNGNFKWAFKIGGSSQDEVGDIALDSAGNFIITGFFRGSSVDFDPSASNLLLNSFGESGWDPGYGGDVFVAKYDTNGIFKWAFNVGSTDIGDNGVGVYADKNNDIVVTGYFRGQVDFDPSTGSTVLDQANGTLFVAKYNSNGLFQWAFNAGQGGTTDNTGFDIVTDNSNNVIVTGFFQGSNIDFNPSAGVNNLTSSGSFDFFVAKYSPTGQYMWAKSVGGSGVDVGRGVAVDLNDNIYATGDYNSSSINFNAGNAANILSNKGGNDLFLVKYSPSGTHLWSFGTGGAGSEFGMSINRDQLNNILITGAFTGTNVDFDPSPNNISLSSKGGNDIYAVKYSPEGNFLCSFSVGGTGNDMGKAISSFGNFSYITGVFSGSNIDFDPTIGAGLMSAQAEDAFFAKYDWTIIPAAGSISGQSNCLTGQSQLTFNATSGSGPFTLYISNGVAINTYTNIQSGVPFSIATPGSATTYTLTGIKDANVCSAVSPANSSVVISPTGIPIVTSGNTAICKLDSVQLTANGGITYQWIPSTGLSNPFIANPKASPLATTTYKVIVTDSSGCKDSASLVVSVKPSPIITVSPDDLGVCPGDSLQLTASGGVSYQWFPSTGLSNPAIPNPKASPANATTYKLIAISIDGCKDSIEKTIGIYPIPTAVVNPGGSFCQGDSLQLSASGGTSYRWFPTTGLNNPFSPSTKASPASTSIYNVIVINSRGCKDTAQTTVTLNPKPTIVVTSMASICKGDSVQLNASGGTSYQWKPAIGLDNPVSSYPKAYPAATTTYKVFVTNDLGCTDSSSVLVTVNQPPVISVMPTNAAFCPGDSVQLNATGGVTYQWSPILGLSNPIVANPKASPLTSTNYKLVVTDSNGCKDSTWKTVTRNSLPSVSISPSVSICPGDSISLSSSGGIRYQWYPSLGLSNANISNPKASPPGTIVYNVIASNAEGCKDSSSTTVTVKPKPVIVVSPSIAICKGDTALLSASGGVSYQWSPGLGLSNPSVSNPQAYPSTTTAYAVVVTGNNSCTDSASTLVTINLPPVIGVTPDVAVCTGDSVQLTATGGTGYQWWPATGLNNSLLASPLASPAASIRYKVLVSSIANCIDSAFVTVAVNPKPVITLTPSISICKGDSAQLTASGGLQYNWYPNMGLTGALIPNPIVYPDSTITYTAVVTNAHGCKDSSTTIVTVLNKPTPDLGLDRTICAGENLVLDGRILNGSSYVWNTGETTPTITIGSPGIYFVKAMATGCINPAIDSIVVQGLPDPFVFVGKDTTICNFSTITINAVGRDIDSYIWNTGSTDSLILVSRAGTYSVIAKNRCGESSDAVIVEVDICADDLFFPTGFTPNSDQKNDVFKAAFFQGLQVIDYELQIFNRWGERVFSTRELNKGWDGRINGKEQASGVFVWIAKYRKSVNGKVITQKGTTTLIR